LQRLTAGMVFDPIGGMGIQRLVYGAIWASMCWWLVPNAAFAQRYIPDCAGSPEISQTRVVRVERNGDLILRDGRAVVLEGVRLPEGPRLADALALLRALTDKGAVTFTATPPKLDRYGRIRVQGFSEVWLQTALLERGLAQVMISPDRDECFPELYEAEALARSRHAGLWGDKVHLPRDPQMAKSVGRFHLMEGRVVHVRPQEGRTVISFEGARGVLVVVPAGDRRAFRDFDLEGLVGQRIRVRGIVQDNRRRHEIALSNPAQIEFLDR
jgi:micrococcal nuclease